MRLKHLCEKKAKCCDEIIRHEIVNHELITRICAKHDTDSDSIKRIIQYDYLLDGLEHSWNQERLRRLKNGEL